MSRGTSLSYQLTSTIGKRDVAQLLSPVWLLATPWTAVCQASLSFTVSWSLVTFTSTESVMSSTVTHFSSCSQSFPASGIRKRTSIRAFFNEKDAALRIRSPMYWSFNFSLSPSNEYSGLIYFKIDCLTSLLPKALKSFLQHHSLLYDSTITSVHDYWLYDLCWQSNVSALETEHRNSDRFYFLGLQNHWGLIEAIN